MTRYLLELKVVNPATLAETVIRVTERSSFTPWSGGAGAALSWYRPWGKRLVNYELDLLSGGTVGEALIGNANRWLDPYMGWAWRSGRILRGPLDRFAPYSAFVPILSLDVVNCEFLGDEVSVQFRDARTVWDAAIPRAAFAGTNDGPVGLEGAGDMAGTEKPLVFGSVLRAPAVLVNAALLIYQWHDGAGVASAVDIGGLDIPISARTTDITNPALVVPAGQCVVDDTRSLVRFGSAVARPVAVSGATSGGTLAALLAQIGARVGFTGSFVTDGLPAGFGWVVGNGETGRAILDALVEATGGWWQATSTGDILTGLYPSLDGAASGVGALSSVLRLDVAASVWTDPIWRVEVNWQRNWAPLTDDEIDPSLSESAAARLKRDWFNNNAAGLPAVAEDGAIRAAWPDAEVLRIQAAVGMSTDAATVMAGRLLALRRRPRYTYMASVPPVVARTFGRPSLDVRSDRIGSTEQVAVNGTWRQALWTGASTEDGRIFKMRLLA